MLSPSTAVRVNSCFYRNGSESLCITICEHVYTHKRQCPVSCKEYARSLRNRPCQETIHTIVRMCVSLSVLTRFSNITVRKKAVVSTPALTKFWVAEHSWRGF